MSDKIIIDNSVNCQVCSFEHLKSELETITLSGSESPILVCESCISNNSASTSFKDAADIINDIISIAKSSKDPERRLRQIKSLVGE